jgi:hypothetical protein
MTDEDASGDRAISEFPRKAVGQNPLSIDGELTVAITVDGSSPNSAAVCHMRHLGAVIDVLPKLIGVHGVYFFR